MGDIADDLIAAEMFHGDTFQQDPGAAYEQYLHSLIIPDDADSEPRKKRRGRRRKNRKKAAVTYTPPEPLSHPFQKGEVVEVCDRNLETVSEEKVAYAGKQVVRLAGGRRFRATDGHWIGANGVYPWPSIRHKQQSRSE